MITKTVKKMVENMNPITMYRHMKHLVVTKGWKIGIIAIAWELTEHFVVPAILIASGHETIGILTGTLPIGELVFYPVTLYLMK
jgi:hypothetical protein